MREVAASTPGLDFCVNQFVFLFVYFIQVNIEDHCDAKPWKIEEKIFTPDNSSSYQAPNSRSYILLYSLIITSSVTYFCYLHKNLLRNAMAYILAAICVCRIETNCMKSFR
jgi:hypothetical protein